MLIWVQYEFFKTAPISISHSFVLSVQFESGPHLCRSTIFPLVQVSRPHLYWSVIHFFCQFELSFLESHLYQSIIVLSVWVWVFGTTPILIGHSSCRFEILVFGTAPILIGHCPCQFEFVFFGTASISIGHCLISWVKSVQSWATLYPLDLWVHDTYFGHVVGHPTPNVLMWFI